MKNHVMFKRNGSVVIQSDNRPTQLYGYLGRSANGDWRWCLSLFEHGPWRTQREAKAAIRAFVETWTASKEEIRRDVEYWS